MTRDEEDRAIEQVTHRLMTRFHELSPNLVSTTVQRLHTQFADSRIRDFIPLLVERTAREQLTGASLGASNRQGHGLESLNSR